MNEREKELKFLEIFGGIDDMMILEAAASPQKEIFAGEKKQQIVLSVGGDDNQDTGNEETHLLRNGMRLWKSAAGRAACAAVVVLLGLSCIFRNEVRAAIQEFSTLIGKALGLTEDLTPYAEMLNMKQTKDGISVTLKEAILSDDHLMAVLEMGSESGGSAGLSASNSSVIKIDGRDIDCASIGTSYLDGEHCILEWGFGSEEISDMADIVFDTEISRGMGDAKPVAFEFAFSASREELEKNTLTCDIGKKLEIQPDVYVNIERLTVNSIYGILEISGSSELASSEAEYFLKGNDSLGNPVRFTLERIDGEQYIFKTDSAFGVSETAPSMESEWIELQFYKLELETEETQEEWEDDGEIYSAQTSSADMEDAKPVGKKFRIELDRK